MRTAKIKVGRVLPKALISKITFKSYGQKILWEMITQSLKKAYKKWLNERSTFNYPTDMKYYDEKEELEENVVKWKILEISSENKEFMDDEISALDVLYESVWDQIKSLKANKMKHAGLMNDKILEALENENVNKYAKSEKSKTCIDFLLKFDMILVPKVIDDKAK